MFVIRNLEFKKLRFYFRNVGRYLQYRRSEHFRVFLYTFAVRNVREDHENVTKY